MDRSKWEYKKLGDICKSINAGGTPSRSKTAYWNGNIPWVKIKDMNSKYVSTTEEFITEEGLYNSSAKVFEPGTILYSIFATIGAAAILNIRATTNQAIAGIVLGDEQNRDFFYYYLTYLKSHFETISKGVAQNNINLSVLRNQMVFVPPISDQQRIVAELDCLNEMIALKQEQLKEFDKLAQSIFYDMFGDPVENEKGWKSVKLGELSEIVRGGSPRPINEYLGGNIPWIKIGDATIGDNIYIVKTKEHIIEKGLNKTRYIPKGSLIFANCGVSLGFARILKINGCIHDGWLAFMNIKEEVIDKIFLLKSLNACTQYFRNTAPDGTQPNLNTTIMKNFCQILPPLALQQQFAEKIQAIEEQKELVKQSIAETQHLLDSRMDYYFD